eukprot:1136292-Pelagomonas_calceolata.AAC.5
MNTEQQGRFKYNLCPAIHFRTPFKSQPCPMLLPPFPPLLPLFFTILSCYHWKLPHHFFFAALFLNAALASCVATQASLVQATCPEWSGAPDTHLSCRPKNVDLHNCTQPCAFI